MRIVAGDKHFRELNEEINTCPDAEIELDNVCGQRYICSGLSGKKVTIHGIPGNALCCYLDGCDVEVLGNAQDATGDTMNSGTLTIHGHCGDATGYAMRGGTILIEGNVGYRAGIHMKAYQTHIPVLVVGGEAGSFLGEYQAGGYIIVLGLNTHDHAPSGVSPLLECTAARYSCVPTAICRSTFPRRCCPTKLMMRKRRKLHRSCGSLPRNSARMPTRFLLTVSLSLCRTAQIRIAPCM